MKVRYLVVLVVLGSLTGGTAAAQPAPAESGFQLRDPLMRQERVTLSVLLGYGGASMAAGGGLLAVDDSFARGLAIQQLAWGAINATIAGVGLLQLSRESKRDEPAAHWRKQRVRLRRILWVNAALDVLYVAAGLTVLSMAESRRNQGTGAGIAIQGTGLLVFDTSAALSF